MLDTWTTNKTNGSKYDSKIVLRGHHNRHHNGKLKMWTQKFDLIEKMCIMRTTYQRDLISPTPIGSSTEKGVHHLRDISTCRYNIDLPLWISRHFNISIKSICIKSKSTCQQTLWFNFSGIRVRKKPSKTWHFLPIQTVRRGGPIRFWFKMIVLPHCGQ